MAGASTTYEKEKVSANTEIHKFSFVADDGDGSVDSKVSLDPIHGFITRVVTNPGTPAPTADYDITLSDKDAVDVLGGAGADRAAASSEQIMPLVGAVSVPCRVDSPLTLAVSGNLVNSAEGEVVVYVERDDA